MCSRTIFYDLIRVIPETEQTIHIALKCNLHLLTSVNKVLLKASWRYFAHNVLCAETSLSSFALTKKYTRRVSPVLTHCVAIRQKITMLTLMLTMTF